MLKFIKGNLENIDNVSVYPITSLVIFFLFFVCLFWKVFKTKKEQFNMLSEIPFENNKD